MSIVRSSRRPLDLKRLPWLALLLLALAGPWSGVAAQTPSTGRPPAPDPGTPRPVPPLPPLTTSTAASDVEEPQGDPMDDLESKEPADGKWIKTDDGREYFVTRLKKVEGTVFRASEHEIIYKRLYSFELDHEDDEYWYIRYYRSIEADQAIEKTQQDRLEQLEAIKASYRFTERTVDRMIFGAYDQGLPRQGPVAPGTRGRGHERRRKARHRARSAAQRRCGAADLPR